MKHKITVWQIAGFIFTGLGGVLLHFLYDLSEQNPFAALFSAVNESTWEHMKLLFFPMALFALIQSRRFEETEAFWCIKLYGILTGLILIPVLFYTLNGVFGPTPDFINIGIFFIAAAASYFLEWKLFTRGNIRCTHSRIALLILALLAVLFALFTFYPPKIPLFCDPQTGTYGIAS